ncbi:DUF4832 domain-containing protein [Candidatus Saccharibacteria bacterium]|nr:DUF4832 domain-containing protein [Candidatus Saccharibacteria bacterium]
MNENDAFVAVPNTGALQNEAPIIIGSCSMLLAVSAIIIMLFIKNKHKNNEDLQKHFLFFNKKQIIVGAILFLATAMVSFGAAILNEKTGQVMAVDNSGEEQTTNETDGISVKIEPMSLNVNIKKGEKEKFASTYHDVIVESGASYGYTLGVYASGTDISSSETKTKISGLGVSEEPSVLGRNTWGVATTEPVDVTSKVWQNVPGSESDMRIIKVARTISEIGSAARVYYGVNAGDDLESGEYGTTINYVVVPNAIDDLEVQDISYADSKEVLPNPDRGVYIPLRLQYNAETGLFGEKSDVISAAAEANRRKVSLVHLRIDLSAWSGNANESGEDLPMTSEQVASLARLLNYFRMYSVKVIPRFSYDATALDQEPKSLDTVMQHLEALRPLFEENKDVITSVDAGILGPWGEMHSTSGIYATDETLRQIVLKWLDVLPKDLTVNVRTPVQYRIVLGSLENDSEDRYRLGIFNDGYLGSESDLGSYHSGITRDIFVDWMETQGNYTFYGGEVTRADPDEPDYVPEMEQWSEGSFVAQEMPRTHTSYFNSEFNLKILRDKWQNQIYENSDDEYDGETYYKYLTDHIGYRIVIRNSELTPSVQTGGIAALRLNLENVGFARLIQKQKVYLILEKDGVYRKAELDTDISGLMSRSDKTYTYVFSVPSDLAAGNWNVYYKINNANSENYPVSFANANVYNENLGANKVGQIQVTEGTEQNIGFRQLNTSAQDLSETSGLVEAKKKYVQGVITYRLNSNNQVILSREHVLLTRGETLSLSDPEGLKNKGFEMLSNYYKPKFYTVLSGWQMAKEVTIPLEDSESSYWIDVYVRTSPNPDFELVYVCDGNVIERVVTDKVAPGAVIDLDDPDGLASMDIVPLDGYRITHFASGVLTNWAGVTRVTMPTSDLDDWYILNVYLEDAE